MELVGFQIDIASVFTFALVAVQTGALWYCLEQSLSRTLNRARRTIFFLIYIACAGSSTAFAYGLWWEIIGFPKDARISFDRLVNAVEENRRGVDEGITSLVGASTSLRDQAEAKRQEEINTGGSCDNDPSQIAGDGPFAWERAAITENIAEFTSSFERELRRQQQNLTEKIGRTRDQAGELERIEDTSALKEQVALLGSELNTVIVQFNAALTGFKVEQSTNLSRIRRAVSPLSEGETTDSVVLRAQNGRGPAVRRQCQDEEQAAGVAQLAFDLSNLAEVAPLEVSSITEVRPVKFAMESLFLRVWGLLTGAGAAKNKADIDVLSLSIAVLVDTFILIFGLMVIRRLIRPGHGTTWIKDNLDHQATSGLKQLVEDYTTVMPNGRLAVVIPTDAWEFAGRKGTGSRGQNGSRSSSSSVARKNVLNHAILRLMDFRIVRRMSVSADTLAPHKQLAEAGWQQLNGESAPAGYKVVDRAAWDELVKSTVGVNLPSSGGGHAQASENGQMRWGRYGE